MTEALTNDMRQEANTALMEVDKGEQLQKLATVKIVDGHQLESQLKKGFGSCSVAADRRLSLHM